MFWIGFMFFLLSPIYEKQLMRLVDSKTFCPFLLQQPCQPIEQSYKLLAFNE